jgi:outer membrane receptor for ferrienterochelin and colicins
MSRRSRAGWLLLASTAAMLARSAVAQAQTVDQTALEQLFGEPVTTSATGKPQRASEVPAEMVIVTADQIRQSGAQTIPDALRFVPGIDVRSYGLLDAAVGVRGNNTALNPRVLVLLDGRQVFQDDYGLTAWSVIPVTLNEIRQIEIIKGPSAALYGFDAVDGVINIVTYDPLRDKINDVRVDAGTQSQAAAQAVATAQIAGRRGVRLSAQGLRATEDPGLEGDDPRQQPHSGMLAIDSRLQIAPGLEWDLSGSISSLDSSYYVDTGLYIPAGLKANSLRSKLSDDTRFGLLQLDAYRNENRTSDSSPLDPNAWRQDVIVVQASDLVKFGNHTLRFAGEYRDNTISSSQSFNGRLGYVNLAGSVMWDWRILPWLSLTNAFREDCLWLNHQGPQFVFPDGTDLYHAAQITEPSFNTGAVLKLTPDDTLRLTAARAVQLPSLFDFGYARASGFGLLVGNTGLKPSALLSYGIDYDRRLPPLASVLRVAVFTQHAANSIGSPFGSGISALPSAATSPIGPGLLLFSPLGGGPLGLAPFGSGIGSQASGQVALEAKNFGGTSETGIEIGLKGSTVRLHWDASYSLALVDDHSPAAALESAPSISYQRQTPTQSVILAAGTRWGPVDLDVQARWQSHFDDFVFDPALNAIHEIGIANYLTVNARLAYRVTDRITAALLAQQLNRQSIAESAGVPMARRVIATIEVGF